MTMGCPIRVKRSKKYQIGCPNKSGMLHKYHSYVTGWVTMKEWRTIRNFTDYSVSNYGVVRNDDTGRIMSLLVNQTGVVHVGLTRNRKLHKRAVALLVAETFLKRKPEETFVTPINLDGDRFNNHVGNLVWRPRWFAVKYFQQFRRVAEKTGPIEEMKTHEVFETPWEAVTKYGLLYEDILLSLNYGRRVWPTGQRFDPISKTDIRSLRDLRI
jgi:hypothetical protein